MYKSRVYNTVLQIIEGDRSTLLSAETSKTLGLVKILADVYTMKII
jgi:hypothetical protein